MNPPRNCDNNKLFVIDRVCIRNNIGPQAPEIEFDLFLENFSDNYSNYFVLR